MPATRENFRPLLIVVCLAQFMVILDVAVVNVALPSMRTGLHFSTTGLQWVVNAYTLTFAGFLMLGGRSADLLGRRRVLVAGTALFALASLACALSDTRGLLIAARALQGFGGAIVSPATLAIITSSLPEGRERNRGLAYWGAVGGLGASSGALLGGVLIQSLGWPAIFAINVPVGVAVIALALHAIPVDERREGARHFDAAGALLVTTGLMALTYGIVRTGALGWGAPGVLVPLAAAVVLLGGFGYVEGRVSRWPLVPLSIFRLAQLRAANLVVVLLYFALFSSFFFITLYMQQVLGDDALKAGLSFLPMTLSVFTGSSLAARVVARFGLRTAVTAGMLLCTVGMGLFTGLRPGGSYFALVLPGAIVSGLGMGLALVSSTIAATQGVPAGQSGLASGLLNMARLFGGALGLAVLSTVAAGASSHGVAPLQAMTDGFGTAFRVGAAITLAGALVAATLLAPRRRAGEPAVEEVAEEPELEAVAA
ncbi:MAG TPA: MFS transporter [Solirubrobacteraceae bacterium]|nr:MFS transporter [Solirubrobacteraceae bacterium]